MHVNKNTLAGVGEREREHQIKQEQNKIIEYQQRKTCYMYQRNKNVWFLSRLRSRSETYVLLFRRRRCRRRRRRRRKLLCLGQFLGNNKP